MPWVPHCFAGCKLGITGDSEDFRSFGERLAEPSPNSQTVLEQVRSAKASSLLLAGLGGARVASILTDMQQKDGPAREERASLQSLDIVVIGGWWDEDGSIEAIHGLARVSALSLLSDRQGAFGPCCVREATTDMLCFMAAKAACTQPLTLLQMPLPRSATSSDSRFARTGQISCWRWRGIGTRVRGGFPTFPWTDVRGVMTLGVTAPTHEEGGGGLSTTPAGCLKMSKICIYTVSSGLTRDVEQSPKLSTHKTLRHQQVQPRASLSISFRPIPAHMHRNSS